MKRCAVLLFASVLLGCPTRRPEPVSRPRAPEALLATVRVREDRVKSLRARFQADVTAGSAHRSAEGVLLVRKPDRFRLRLMLPFGLTVMDYLSVGAHTWLEAPLAGEAAVASSSWAPFSRAELAAAFLRGPDAFPGHCDAQPLSADLVRVDCSAEDGAVRRALQIDRRTETVVEETSYAEGSPRATVRYNDYRLVSDDWLPFGIVLQDLAQQQTVTISIRGYEVNPALADALFAPVER